MLFYVLEFQTTDQGGSVLATTFTDRSLAEGSYHTILAAAAVSSVKKHGVMLCNEDMFVIKQEIYTHYEPEPEPNEE